MPFTARSWGLPHGSWLPAVSGTSFQIGLRIEVTYAPCRPHAETAMAPNSVKLTSWWRKAEGGQKSVDSPLKTAKTSARSEGRQPQIWVLLGRELTLAQTERKRLNANPCVRDARPMVASDLAVEALAQRLGRETHAALRIPR